ncbi:MAG TPA: hypothetical protein EYH35_05490 [Thiotrichaceae bacterium]|nr:hypothetical protein [Thiotrichaceae bacterium]
MKKTTLLIPLVILLNASCSQQQAIPSSTAIIPEATDPEISYRKKTKQKYLIANEQQKHIAPIAQEKRYYQPPQIIQTQHQPQQLQKAQYQPQFIPPKVAQHLAPQRKASNEMHMIANKIFKNEAGGKRDKLVHWNHGENFAAMGIGHFTWYPSGQNRHRFGNTFPGLLDYLERHNQNLPNWLKIARHTGAPWQSREQLMREKGSYKVSQLEDLLFRTKDLQAKYIIERAKRAMPKLVKNTTQHLRPKVAKNLNAVANTPGGWYALVDYVNFKGEGLNRHGGYRGQNWGLLQVLENMAPATPGNQALHNFADSALAILKRRVRNSPPRRNEARWLNGWSKRIDTYRYPLI